jgi:hypothetical protein
MALRATFPQHPAGQDTPSLVVPLSADEWDDVPSRAGSRELTRQQLEIELVGALVDADRSGRVVAPASLINATRFLAWMPHNWPSPSVVVEDDGDIAFDWVLGRRQMLTVSFGPSQQVGYSALMGREPIYGKATLSAGPVPETVAFVMNRLRQDDPA